MLLWDNSSFPGPGPNEQPIERSQLEADLAVARDFKPMNSEELRSLLAIAETEAGDGRHEQFKSTRRFDNPIYREMHGLPVEGDQL